MSAAAADTDSSSNSKEPPAKRQQTDKPVPKATLVLAFDVETSGACPFRHNILSLGAVVVDTDGKKHDEMRADAYVPDDTVFEPRCKRTFWHNKLDLLARFKVKPGVTRKQAEESMFEQFHSFRLKWERLAAQSGQNLIVATDNKAFDVQWVNYLYAMNSSLNGLPYTATPHLDDEGVLTQSYGTCVETHSMQMGALMLHDKGRLTEWGCTEAVIREFEVESPWAHEPQSQHEPVADSFSIAAEYLMLMQAAIKHD